MRNIFLDIVKGFLILLVCIGHAIQCNTYIDTSFFWIDPLFKLIYTFHMPLFMAIAGYLSYKGISRAKFGYSFVIHRAINLILPIFFWAVLYKSLVFIISDTPFSFYQYILLFTSSLWFLWVLFVASVFMLISSKFNKYQYIIIAFLFIAVFTLQGQGHVDLFLYMLPFFIAGYYTAKTSVYNRKIFQSNAFLLIITITSVILYAFWTKDSYIYVSGMNLAIDNIKNIIYRWVAGFNISLLVLIVLYRLQDKIPSSISLLLTKMGTYSICIYIISIYTQPKLGVLFNLNNYPIFADIYGIIVGIIVSLLCLLIGMVIMQNKYLALFLFGKYKIIAISKPPQK